MRTLISLLLVAAVAVGVALLGRYQDGYVLVVAPPWRIESSLVLFAIALIALVALAYGVLRVVGYTLHLPTYVEAYRRRTRRERFARKLHEALQAYFEGRYSRTAKLAAEAWSVAESSPLPGLLAARAAHFSGDFEKRDLWLARAEQASGDERNAILATRAELLIDERRFEDAQQILTELLEHGPLHLATLRMRLRAAQGLQNWDEVLRVLGQLEKHHALPKTLAARQRSTATLENLRRKAFNADSLAAFWSKLPDRDRRNPQIAAAAGRLFIRVGDCREAYRVVRTALETQWDSALVLLFGECCTDDSIELIGDAERWLKTHPRDAALLLTLGRLCMRRELWGKAKSYLDASLSEHPSRAAHVEAARLAEQLGRESDAQAHYRAACDDTLPAEPLGSR